jgi:hypothetical protein
MKAAPLIILFSFFICAGCDKETYNLTVYYDSMYLKRRGGGAFEFNLYPTKNPEILRADVIRNKPIDTIIPVTINRSAETRSIFSSYFKAMKNEIELTGDYKPSTLFSGTFVNIYIIKDSVKTEVTNIALRDSLLKFERLVREKVQ